MAGDEPYTWRVRIMDRARDVKGAGILLGRGQVLTCAHVVTAALGGEAGDEVPEGAVLVDFPGCQLAGQPLRARVDQFGWLPSTSEGRRDIAVLNIEGHPPAEAKPPAFRRCGSEDGLPIRVFGHPDAEPGGVWSNALMGGPTENNELIQLDGHTGIPIGPGFTGAGVIDRRTDAVIGYVVRVVKPESAIRVAWMMPLEKLLEYLPDYRFLLPPGPERSSVASTAPPVTSIPDTPVVSHSIQLTDSAPVTRIPAIANLSPGQQAIITTLSTLAGAESLGWIDNLVARLKNRMGPYFAVPPLGSVPSDISNLVLACLSQPGAMYELLDELYSSCSEPPPPPLRELNQLVSQNVPDPLLLSRERKALYELIADVSFAQAAEAYSEAVGPVGNPIPADVHNVISIAAELEQITGPPEGLPPLIAFAQSLARIASPANAGRISHWIDAYLRRVGLSSDLRLPFAIGYAPRGPSPSEPAYLVVRLDADRLEWTPPQMDQARYSVTAWLQRGTRLGSTLRRAALPRRLSQVSSLVEGLLARAEQELTSSATILTVEFILPRDLLWYAAVDQWPVGHDNQIKRLGELYPVVVRSLERMYDSEIRPRWERKWAWTADNCERPDPWAYQWLAEEGQLAPEEMFRRLSSDYSVCLALGYPPSRPHGLSRDEISVGLQAGLPIMVWCREGQSTTAFSDLRDLLGRHGLLKLPMLVAEQRAESGRRRELQLTTGSEQAGNDDLASRLTLLFDPADRIPEPDVRIGRHQ